MEKGTLLDVGWTTVILLLVCGVLIGLLGSSLYWKGQAEKEISRALTGKHFIGSNGGLYYTPMK